MTLSLGIPLFGKKQKNFPSIKKPAFIPSTYLDPKVGGVPIVPLPLFQAITQQCNFNCKICSSPLILLFQACTPFDRNDTDRLLYILACNRFECSRSAESVFSFICYIKKPQQNVSNTELNNQNILNPKISQQNITSKGTVKDKGKCYSGNKKTPNESFFNPFLTNLNQNISDTETGNGYDKNIDSVYGEDDGAIYESKNISLETSLAVYPIAFEDREVECYDSDSDDEDEDDLLESLTQSLSITKESFNQCIEFESMEFETEPFEKILPHNINGIFYTFEKTLSKDPWQILRYSWNGSPLLTQPLCDTKITCSICGSSLVFECQLMPALLHLLQTERHASLDNSECDNVSTVQSNFSKKNNEIDTAPIRENSKGMDWSTILIYSCSTDCGLIPLSNDGMHLVQFSLSYPMVIIQYEP